jgi:hypothetical protein
MPKTLDVLIGLSTIMLIISMSVTMFTQFFTSLFNTQGRSLRKGIANLLSQIDSDLRDRSLEIAGAILSHPLIGDPMSRFGTVIHRDELTRLLLEFAAGEGQKRLGDPAKTALQEALKRNGIADPSGTLEKLRGLALQIERDNPGISSFLSRDRAILEGATSTLVAKLNGWFDQTIDRVSGRFTVGAHAITFTCALLLAFALQLDSIGIVNTIWINDALRQQLIAQAEVLVEKDPNSPIALKAPVEAQPPAQSDDADILAQPSRAKTAKPALKTAEVDSAEKGQAEAQAKYLNDLASFSLVILPNLKTWGSQYNAIKLPGILLSTLLLSLGAPFWYNALKNLLRLRTLIAGRDDEQRLVRQSNDPVVVRPQAKPGSVVS